MQESLLVQLAAPIALILGGALGAVLARWLSDSRGEWRQVAEARGEALEDREDRIRALEERVAHLEGKYEALESLKAAEIAGLVVQAIKGVTDGTR